MKGSGPETVPVRLTVQTIRVWPIFIKGDIFPAGYVAEAKIAETGGYRFGGDKDREGALGELEAVLEEEGIAGRPKPVDLKECPDIEPRVIHSSAWEAAPHPNDKQNRPTHARRAVLTTGASITVQGFLDPRDAQSAVGDYIIRNREQLMTKKSLVVRHKYDPNPEQKGEPEL